MEYVFDNIIKNWDRILLVIWVWSLQIKIDKLEEVTGTDDKNGKEQV